VDALLADQHDLTLGDRLPSTSTYTPARCCW
jgi:hypothetical protein